MATTKKSSEKKTPPQKTTTTQVKKEVTIKKTNDEKDEIIEQLKKDLQKAKNNAEDIATANRKLLKTVENLDGEKQYFETCFNKAKKELNELKNRSLWQRILNK